MGGGGWVFGQVCGAGGAGVEWMYLFFPISFSSFSSYVRIRTVFIGYPPYRTMRIILRVSHCLSVRRDALKHNPLQNSAIVIYKNPRTCRCDF